MKKVILALAIIGSASMFFASCKSKEKCDAYRSESVKKESVKNF